MEVLDRRLPRTSSRSAARKDEHGGCENLAAALLSEQMPGLIAGQAGVKVGLVVTPGLTGLQDSPDDCPARRLLPVQAHTPGDGPARCRMLAAIGWQAAKKPTSAHGSPMRRDRIDGQAASTCRHPPQARPVQARRGRGLGGAHRAGMSLARSGHLPRRCEAGPYGRSASAAISHITGLVLTGAGLACGLPPAGEAIGGGARCRSSQRSLCDCPCLASNPSATGRGGPAAHRPGQRPRVE